MGSNAGSPPALPRIWPAVILVAAYWIFRFVTGSLLDLSIYVGFFSMVGAAGLLILLFFAWWLTNRRIKVSERLLAIAAIAACAFVAVKLSDKSIGLFSVLFFGLPLVISAWTLWLLVSRRRSVVIQRIGLLAILVLVLGNFTLVRNDGIDGSQQSAIHWRWSPKAEDLFLAERSSVPSAAQPERPAAGKEHAPLELAPGDWPGFRGPLRDGTLQGVQFATDWEATPPKLIWRRRVGPGWSSFAVIGDRLFTQEQRGEVEAVVCLQAGTGAEIWSHEDKARFWDMVAGAGPRATPTFDHGRIYALGATGVLTCFDAATGRMHWSRNIVDDSGVKLPMWGFSSSPLVVDGVVIVYAGGADPKGLLAYRTETGEPAWTATTGPISYSSPQLIHLGGESQVLLLSDQGLLAVDPATGKTAWQYAALAPNIWRAVQPRPSATARCSSVRKISAWYCWIWRAMEKPGPPSSIGRRRPCGRLTTISFCKTDSCMASTAASFAAPTSRAANAVGRRAATVTARFCSWPTNACWSSCLRRARWCWCAQTPEKHQELGRLQAIQGKTWNHPVIAHGHLYVRNDEEMACYQLQMIESPKAAQADRPVAPPR